MENNKQYNQEATEFKINLIHKVQTKLPNAILGGSLAAYLLGLEYKTPLDIDIFTEDVTIEEFFDCLKELNIKYREYEKSLKENYTWSNNKFVMHIEYGYSIALNSQVYFDFKRVKFDPPYTLETQTVNWKGKKILVESREILEQGIRSFQNYCLEYGHIEAMDRKYKNIDIIFPNRKNLI